MLAGLRVAGVRQDAPRQQIGRLPHDAPGPSYEQNADPRRDVHRTLEQATAIVRAARALMPS